VRRTVMNMMATKSQLIAHLPDILVHEKSMTVTEGDKNGPLERTSHHLPSSALVHKTAVKEYHISFSRPTAVPEECAGGHDDENEEGGSRTTKVTKRSTESVRPLELLASELSGNYRSPAVRFLVLLVDRPPSSKLSSKSTVKCRQLNPQ